MKVSKLKEKVTCEGIGLHTGQPARLDFLPADKKGIFFRKGTTVIPVSVESVIDSSRGITLGVGGEKVQTVEHLLSALRWMGISGLEIQIDGEEIPALDGSAKKWMELFSPHLISSAENFPEKRIQEAYEVQENGKFIKMEPSDKFFIRYTIDFPGTPVGRQTWEGEINSHLYEMGIAPARTFGFLHEVEALKKRGLGLGGNLENAVVIGDGGFLAPLRFQDEMVRHKVLDLLGDLALLPWTLLGKLEIYKGSHSLHLALAKALEARTSYGRADGGL